MNSDFFLGVFGNERDFMLVEINFLATDLIYQD